MLQPVPSSPRSSCERRTAANSAGVAARDLPARVQAKQVREVAVLRLGLLELLAPFQQLALAADRVGPQLRARVERAACGTARRSPAPRPRRRCSRTGRGSSARSIVAPAEIAPGWPAVPELVLGRRRRRGDEVALAVVDEPVEAELGGAAQHRIGACRAARRRRRRTGSAPTGAAPATARPSASRPHRVAVAPVADHARVPPDVGVVVRGPAARAVHRRRRPRAGHRELADEGEQRLVQLGEVGRSPPASSSSGC